MANTEPPITLEEQVIQMKKLLTMCNKRYIICLCNA